MSASSLNRAAWRSLPPAEFRRSGCARYDFFRQGSIFPSITDDRMCWFSRWEAWRGTRLGGRWGSGRVRWLRWRMDGERWGSPSRFSKRSGGMRDGLGLGRVEVEGRFRRISEIVGRSKVKGQIVEVNLCNLPFY